MTNKNGREIKIEDLFGEAVVDTQRDVKETAAFFDAVKKDLGICGPIGQALDEKRNDSVIKDFLVDVCMNIRYYTGQLNNAMKRRRMYMILNVLLIIAVPILVYLMSLVGLEISGSHSTQMHIAIIIAQLTAVLTGLLSLQRTFIEWQKHNSRFSQLWEAKANLKTEYYTLQTKWHGNVNEDSLECFLSDVRNTTINARAIVRQEQDDFFRCLSAEVPVDALSVMKEVQGLVSQLVSGTKPPDAVTKQIEAAGQERRDAYKSLADQRRTAARVAAELAAIKEQIAARENELNEAVRNDDKNRQTELKGSLAKLRDERDKKEAESIIARGALAALTGG